MGESKDSKHAGEIDVLAWSWGASGGKGSTGCIQDLSLTKHIDSATPALIMNGMTGEVSPTGRPGRSEGRREPARVSDTDVEKCQDLVLFNRRIRRRRPADGKCDPALRVHDGSVREAEANWRRRSPYYLGDRRQQNRGVPVIDGAGVWRRSPEGRRPSPSIGVLGDHLARSMRTISEFSRKRSNTIRLPSGAMSNVRMAAPPLRRVSGLRFFVARSSSQKSCDGRKPCM